MSKMTSAQLFLKKHNQLLQDVFVGTQQQAIDDFIAKMNDGLAHAGREIPMIPTYLCNIDRSKIKFDKRILIDAGGTNFRSAVGYFDQNGTAHVENLQKTVMPASGGEVLGKQEFYQRIAQNISRLANEATDVGFCFSYPVDMGADMDGEVVNFSKEVKAPEVVGSHVGAETLKAFAAYGAAQRKIVILNDTVATLLGGMATSNKKYSTYLGYIYGTGTNVCCIVDTKQITKVSGLPVGKMLINMECGGYRGFVMGDFDRAAIHRTDAPTSQLFEKMTSGKYLSAIIEEALAVAQKEHCFRAETHLQPIELKDVSAFLLGTGTMCQMFTNNEDIAFAKEICDLLIRRAALMGATVNAAAALATVTDKSLPVAIVAEGTTFNKLVGYRKYFEQYLDEIFAPHGVAYEIIQGEDLNLVGTLMATMVL